MHEEEVLGKAYDARLMRRLLHYLRPYSADVAIAFVAITAGSAASLAQPYLMKVAIDRYIAAGRVDDLDRLAILYLVILVVAFAAEYVQTWTMQLTGQRVMFDLRMSIYGHLQRLDLKYYDRNPVGRLMTRVTSDVDALNDLFTAGVITIFGDVFALAGIMIIMIGMNWRLALVAFSVLPLIVLVTQWFRRSVRESYRVVRGLIARINAFLQENITGMATVQLFRREPLNFAKFDHIDATHRDANISSIFYYAVFYPAIEAISSLASALIIWYGGGRVMQSALTLGALVAFLQYSQRFFRPISDMSDKFNVLQSAMASSERIFKLLDEPLEVKTPERPVKRQKPVGHIVFDHVWFAYTDEEYVLQDVSFEVRPGQRVGIVGATGSGKTTLINLLLRFYDVRRGRILVDGVDIRELDLAELRGLFSLVLQDVHLFSGTIADNIRLGHSSIDDQRLKRAASAVHAEPFILRLPEGYQSAVAERGSTLSVGQKQLLSFARALAFDPRVLILDEATSSVDTETEIQIRKAIERLMQGRTSIIIAHRLSTVRRVDTETELIIRDALHVLMAGRTTIAIAHRLSTIQDMDKILVLHKGKLRESGTHQELLAHRGIYFKLFELQYKSERQQEPLELRTQNSA